MLDVSLLPFLQGYLIGASLIIAIGAQNAFVLRQGIKKKHVFITAIICSASDAILITLGITGIGTLITKIPMLLIFAKWGGAFFLFLYGVFAFKAAYKPSGLQDSGMSDAHHVWSTVFTLLALTYLNPHVYLDVIVLGSLGAQYPVSQRFWFAVGIILASFTWFFSLAYGARWLAPVFRNPRSWRILDILIGCIMWFIALSLVW